MCEGASLFAKEEDKMLKKERQSKRLLWIGVVLVLLLSGCGKKEAVVSEPQMDEADVGDSVSVSNEDRDKLKFYIGWIFYNNFWANGESEVKTVDELSTDILMETEEAALFLEKLLVHNGIIHTFATAEDKTEVYAAKEELEKLWQDASGSELPLEDILPTDRIFLEGEKYVYRRSMTMETMWYPVANIHSLTKTGERELTVEGIVYLVKEKVGDFYQYSASMVQKEGSEFAGYSMESIQYMPYRMDSWENVYRSQLLHNELGMLFALKDIDKDGTPELLLTEETTETEGVLPVKKIFQYKENAESGTVSEVTEEMELSNKEIKKLEWHPVTFDEVTYASRLFREGK